ncbi:MAG: hypothetical protein M1840_001195 [Geoglossum simile]|nr:MAG: hypothetical protein M1840_001195 [Geoglossum simile]
MSSKDEEQRIRRIVNYKRLTKMKRERKLVSKSFKSRNIEDNLPGANFLKYLNTCHSHTQSWPPEAVPALVLAPAPAPQLASQRSSPISMLLPDQEILKSFFESKMQDQPSEVIVKVKRTWRIVDGQD